MTESFKGTLPSTLVIASLMVLAVSVSFTGPASALPYVTGAAWKQTDWAGGETYPVLESERWPDDYDRYYESENVNAGMQGEIRLENAIPLETSWTQTTREDFESGSLENLDTSTIPGDVILAGDTVIFGDTTNTGEYRPYADYTYIQRVDPGGQYAAPYNGVIIQWRWYPRATTNGAKFKIFRHISGSVWTMVGESEPKNLSSGMNTFSDFIPVKAGDRIGMYSGSDRTYFSETPSYYVSRTEGDITGTSSFTEHTNVRRLPIDVTLKIYLYSGTLISSVHDTKGPETNWREISWGEDLPPDTDVILQTRTGNTPMPDENWSDWSPPYTDPAGELITSPRAWYIQYKVNFSTSDTAHTPVLDWVKIDYITSAMYKPLGQLESSVYDARSPVDWRTITWEAEMPSVLSENKSVELKVYTRTGGTENAYDGSWSEWQEATNGCEVPSPDARYIQYRMELSTQSGKLSPVLEEITIDYTARLWAIIDIDPDTLNLRSRGKWITCYIELPEGYSVENIDVSSIRLNSVVPAEEWPPKPCLAGHRRLAIMTVTEFLT